MNTGFVHRPLEHIQDIVRDGLVTGNPDFATLTYSEVQQGVEFEGVCEPPECVQFPGGQVLDVVQVDGLVATPEHIRASHPGRSPRLGWLTRRNATCHRRASQKARQEVLELVVAATVSKGLGHTWCDLV